MNYLIVRAKPEAKRRQAVIKFTEYDYDQIISNFKEQCKLLRDGEEVTYSKKRKNRPEYSVLRVRMIEGELINMANKERYAI